VARSALAAGIAALACLAAAAPAAAQFDHAEPDVVRVGALINDSQQLDLQTHSYAVDIYLWFKWDNRRSTPRAPSSS
jgi:hypothetical protein